MKEFGREKPWGGEAAGTSWTKWKGIGMASEAREGNGSREKDMDRGVLLHALMGDIDGTAWSSTSAYTIYFSVMTAFTKAV